jgi:hypothetical protein
MVLNPPLTLLSKYCKQDGRSNRTQPAVGTDLAEGQEVRRMGSSLGCVVY